MTTVQGFMESEYLLASSQHKNKQIKSKSNIIFSIITKFRNQPRKNYFIYDFLMFPLKTAVYFPVLNQMNTLHIFAFCFFKAHLCIIHPSASSSSLCSHLQIFSPKSLQVLHAQLSFPPYLHPLASFAEVYKSRGSPLCCFLHVPLLSAV